MVAEGRGPSDFGRPFSPDRKDSRNAVGFSSRFGSNAGGEFIANSASDTFEEEFAVASQPSLSERNCHSIGDLVSTTR